MRRLLLGLVVFLALWTLPAIHSVSHLAFAEAALAQQDPATITVYIARSGERYHRDGCRYLRQSRIATTLKEAVSRGFGPCSVCKPPTIR